MAQAEARLQVYVWFSRGICTCSTGLGRGWAAAILGVALRLSDQIRFFLSFNVYHEAGLMPQLTLSDLHCGFDTEAQQSSRKFELRQNEG